MDIFEAGRCKNIETPSMGQFAISCALFGWLLFSYVPQFARIIGRQSAEGLSTLYITLGSLSGTCAVANIMVLPSSQEDIACCREYTRFGCIGRLLGIFQVTSGVALFWCIMFLYVYYSEEEADAQLHGRRRSLSSPERTFRRARRAIKVLIVVLAFAFSIMLISAVILNRFPWYSQQWANTLGVSVATLACVQWIPQVVTTLKLGHLGSLSLTSLCMGAPYTWIFGISMMIRVGISGWSVWIVYALVGSMQFVLIVTAFVYMIRDKRKNDRANETATSSTSSGWDTFDHGPRLNQEASIDNATECSPLLANRQRHVEEAPSPSRRVNGSLPAVDPRAHPSRLSDSPA